MSLDPTLITGEVGLDSFPAHQHKCDEQKVHFFS